MASNFINQQSGDENMSYVTANWLLPLVAGFLLMEGIAHVCASGGEWLTIVHALRTWQQSRFLCNLPATRLSWISLVTGTPNRCLFFHYVNETLLSVTSNGFNSECQIHIVSDIPWKSWVHPVFLRLLFSCDFRVRVGRGLTEVHGSVSCPWCYLLCDASIRPDVFR